MKKVASQEKRLKQLVIRGVAVIVIGIAVLIMFIMSIGYLQRINTSELEAVRALNQYRLQL
jgi:hypothetical protein